MDLKLPILITIPSTPTSFHCVFNVYLELIMNIIEEKLRYSGITTVELYKNSIWKFRPIRK